jgi:hypothetical protein
VATASLWLLAVLRWRRPAPRRTCRVSPCCVFGRACRRPSSLVTACVVVSYPLPCLVGLFVVVVRSVCLPRIFRYSLSVARLFVFVLVCPLSAVLACWPMSPRLPPPPGCPQCKLSSASLWGGGEGGGSQGRDGLLSVKGADAVYNWYPRPSWPSPHDLLSFLRYGEGQRAVQLPAGRSFDTAKGRCEFREKEREASTRQVPRVALCSSSSRSYKLQAKGE